MTDTENINVDDIIKALEEYQFQKMPLIKAGINRDMEITPVFLIAVLKGQKAEIEKLQLDNHNLWMKADILTDFINGAWIDTENIQTALNIDFSTGMERFDFSRTAEWNPPPLNGQKITTKFRLSHNKALSKFADMLLSGIGTMDKRIISADRVKKILDEMVIKNE